MSTATKTKIPFRGRYLDNITYEYFSNPGTGGIEKEYEEQIDDFGAIKIICTGEKNLYEEIQSHKEECMIENILKRVTNGDISDFRPNGIFADTTQIPTNMIDAMKVQKQAENTFYKLDPEVRAKYNNDWRQFTAQAGSEAWLADMGLAQPATPEAAPITESINPVEEAKTNPAPTPEA